MSFGFGFALPAYPLRGGGGNNPFNQSGPTLDLSFAGVVTDQSDPNGYTLNTNFIIPQYQIAAQYVVWETGVGLVDKTFSQIITFTRASTATYFDSTGTLQSAAVDAPRLDYNPSTLAAQGLLIEESRTNSIRNNTMQGAVAGTPGTLPTNWVESALATGLTRQIIGTGTSNGITYIDVKISGTTSSTAGWAWQFEAATQIAALSGQSWSGSVYFAIVGGSTSNITDLLHRVTERSAAGGYLTESNQSLTAATATLQRFSLARTLNNASTAFVQSGVYFTAASGAAIDITLRIGLPQLELGAFATSVIPTTTTALTRSADVASVNTLSPWYNATEGTLFAESSVNYTVPAASFPLAASLNDNSSNNRIEVGYLTTVVAGFEVSVGGVSQAGLYPSTAAQVRRTAGAYAANDFAVSTNSSAPTTDTSGSIPSVTRLALGTRTSGGTVIHLRRVTYYPRRLSNAELQALTV